MKLGQLIAITTIVAVGLIYTLAGFTDIDPGEVGLKIKKIGDGKGMQDDTLDTGLHWIEPIRYDIATYDSRRRQYSVKDMPAQTKDGQPILVDISLEIGLVDAKVPYLHEKVGKDYFDQVVYPALRSNLRGSTSTQLSDNIYTGDGRAAVQKRVQANLLTHLEKYGIDAAVNLRDIKFVNQDFIKALEDKAKAAQYVIIEARKAEAAAQTAIKVENIAEGEKQKRIKAAEADREERRLAGEGERLKQEEVAKGILAVKKAEAEGVRLQVRAYGGNGETYASVRWAEEMGPNIKVYGFPTGAPGTGSLMDLNGVFKGVFPGGK